MKFPIGRTIAYSIAGLCLAAGIYFSLEARPKLREFDEWRKDRPADIQVDLSQPGEFSGKFVQTCDISHSEEISLIVSPEAAARPDSAKLPENLRCTLRITDEKGGESFKQEVVGEDLSQYGPQKEKFVLALFRPFKRGNYRITITITQGAPALRGVQQRIVARYLICGFDKWPALISQIYGFGCVIAGGIIAVATAVITIVRKRRRRAQDQPA
ncbi:MAG: hypothetical protein HZA50_15615 [Planctomycetes bacterium]|nr:hypothetical protein [Planctomycetota bacterium]